MEDELVQREKKIQSILAEEIEDGAELASAARRGATQMLNAKGYAASDISANVVFEVALGAETVLSSVDFLISLNNRPAMVIKCAAGALSSRERQVVAAARVIRDAPVPVAVVMDPMNAVVLDSLTGKVTGEGFASIPTREQLAALVAGKEYKPMPADKLEREKRVLLAFDAIQCSVPRGGDGGVAIGEPEAGKS